MKFPFSSTAQSKVNEYVCKSNDEVLNESDICGVALYIFISFIALCPSAKTNLAVPVSV